MKKSWPIVIFLIAIIITILFAFNYQGGEDVKSLSEIFPEEEIYPIDIEYEFDTGAMKKVGQDNEALAEPVAIEKPVVSEAVIPKQKVSEVVAKKVTIDENKKSINEVKVAQTTGGTSEQQTNFRIQIASFKDQKSAEEVVSKLIKEEFDAYFLQRNLGDKGIWYRVYVGRFESKLTAQAKLSLIRKSYKDAFIISTNKSN